MVEVVDALDPQLRRLRQPLNVGAGVGLVGSGKRVLLRPAFDLGHHPRMKAIGHQSSHLGAVVPKVGGEEHHPTSGAQHTCQLGIDLVRFGQVLKHAARDHQIDARISQRQRGQVGVVHLNARWHVCEIDQLNPNQPLDSAQVLAQHGCSATATGVQQRAGLRADQRLHVPLEHAVRMGGVVVVAVTQSDGQGRHHGWLPVGKIQGALATLNVCRRRAAINRAIQYVGARSQGVKRGNWKASSPVRAAPGAVVTAAAKPRRCAIRACR